MPECAAVAAVAEQHLAGQKCCGEGRSTVEVWSSWSSGSCLSAASYCRSVQGHTACLQRIAGCTKLPFQALELLQQRHLASSRRLAMHGIPGPCKPFTCVAVLAAPCLPEDNVVGCC